MTSADRNDSEMMSQRTKNQASNQKRTVLTRVLILLQLIAASVLALSCCSWVLSGQIYWLDILSSQQLGIAWVTLLVSLIAITLRARKTSITLIAFTLISMYPVVSQRNWILDTVQFNSKPSGTVRVVSSNQYSDNKHWDRDLKSLLKLNADVIVLMEVHPELNRGILLRGLLDGSGWNWVKRDPVYGYLSPCFILSRHPIERIKIETIEHAERDIFIAKVQIGNKEILVAEGHPHSPRSAERWKLGNEVWSRSLQAFTLTQREHGIPLVIGADLNSGPAGMRARMTKKTGLRSSKPIIGQWGSYPSAWPGLLRTHIDDIWISPGAHAVSWTSINTFGSDHRVIVADIQVDDQN